MRRGKKLASLPHNAVTHDVTSLVMGFDFVFSWNFYTNQFKYFLSSVLIYETFFHFFERNLTIQKAMPEISVELRKFF